MKKRRNYYEGLAVDYSRPEPVPAAVSQTLLQAAEAYIARKEPTLPVVGPGYTLEQIEAENREWWPTHCEAVRQGRGDLLTGEYRDDLVYFCQDGPYYGLTQQQEREQHLWPLIRQPG